MKVCRAASIPRIPMRGCELSHFASLIKIESAHPRNPGTERQAVQTVADCLLLIVLIIFMLIALQTAT